MFLSIFLTSIALVVVGFIGYGCIFVSIAIQRDQEGVFSTDAPREKFAFMIPFAVMIAIGMVVGVASIVLRYFGYIS